MEATIISEKKKHYPVLLNEIISIITPQYGGTFIDCTFGQGGYSKRILEHPNSKVIAIDRDESVKNKAEEISSNFKDRFYFKNLKFSNINSLKIINENIRGILFDLGYSFSQIKDFNKGLSFNSTGKLNMRLGINDFSAHEAINNLSEQDLIKILKYFGDERDNKKIVKNIIKERTRNFLTTEKLVEIVIKSKKFKNSKIHPATKTFQALRIFVNKEISELIYGLINAAKVLKKDGILAVVTFHSLEDKIVKYFFKSLSENKSISRYEPKKTQQKMLFRIEKKKPIYPSVKEIRENPSSRSAKLRYVIKIKDTVEFKTDILEKFNYLLKIEGISKKL